MKKSILPALISICILMLFSVSCSNQAANTVNPPLSEGSWKVSLFIDNGDETAYYAGYTFKFLDNGQLLATKGSVTTNGTWSVAGTTFNIMFTEPVLIKLSDNWLIEEKTAVAIKLKDDNPARNEKLQFIKI